MDENLNSKKSVTPHKQIETAKEAREGSYTWANKNDYLIYLILLKQHNLF